jgi:hypothetical protein
MSRDQYLVRPSALLAVRAMTPGLRERGTVDAVRARDYREVVVRARSLCVDEAVPNGEWTQVPAREWNHLRNGGIAALVFGAAAFSVGMTFVTALLGDDGTGGLVGATLIPIGAIALIAGITMVAVGTLRPPQEISVGEVIPEKRERWMRGPTRPCVRSPAQRLSAQVSSPSLPF